MALAPSGHVGEVRQGSFAFLSGDTKDMHIEMLTLLKTAHLLAIAAALGTALAADTLLVLRGVFRPITAGTIEMAEFLAHFVLLGLVGVWATGIPLAMEVYQVNPEFFTNEKFWVKVIIVVVLSINGLIVHNTVLPLVKSQRGRRLFDGIDVPKRLALAAVGGLSSTSWVFPLFLGVAKELSYVVPAYRLMEAYAVALAAATVGLAVLALATGRAAASVVNMPHYD